MDQIQAVTDYREFFTKVVRNNDYREKITMYDYRDFFTKVVCNNDYRDFFTIVIL